jgi:rhodanese-related sulfurtransferase
MSRYQQMLSNIRPQIKEIDHAQLLQRMQQEAPYILIDVRDAHEWQQGHIPNAMHISRGLLEPNIERVVSDPQAEIILYCGGGGRSALAAFNLQKMGYENVSSLAGGFKTWLDQGNPLVNSEKV